MRALQFFGVCYYFFLAILTSQSWAALTIDQSCLNVPGVGDMTDTINNQMFVLAKQMALNAQETLEEFIYSPQDMTEANRQRINELLAVMALPSNNARFRRTVDGLIDAFRRIGRVSSRSSRRNFFTRTIYCDTDAANFPRYTTNSDGSPIMLDGQPSYQYYCNLCVPPGYLPIGQQGCSEGALGITALINCGTFLVVCGPTFAREPQDFPLVQGDRLQDFSVLEWPQNHIETWFQSRVGTFLHEMHHALVPNSADVNLEQTAQDVVRLKAYGFYGVQRLANEVRTLRRTSAYIYENAETVSCIATSLWLGGALWHNGFAEDWTTIIQQQAGGSIP